MQKVKIGQSYTQTKYKFVILFVINILNIHDFKFFCQSAIEILANDPYSRDRVVLIHLGSRQFSAWRFLLGEDGTVRVLNSLESAVCNERPRWLAIIIIFFIFLQQVIDLVEVVND